METAAITVRWTIDNLKSKVESHKVLRSPNFDGDRWYIQLEFGKEAKSSDQVGIYLRPTASKSASTTEPRRDVHMTLELLTIGGQTLKRSGFRYEFDLSGDAPPGMGFPKFMLVERVLKACTTQDAVVAQVSVSTIAANATPTITPSEPLYKSLEQLFEDSTTDVVFRIRPDESTDCFLEGTAYIAFDDLRAEVQKPESTSTLDDDDSQEWLPSDAEGQEISERPTLTPKTPRKEDGNPSADSPSPSSSLENRFLHQVIITDAGWITYRVLLYWIYTRKLCLTETSSNYLVHLASLASSSAGSTKEEGSLQVPASSLPPQPRRAWLLQRASETKTWDSSSSKVEPASPHALYRLADKLGITEVKELAKTAIVEGFTVENILYELVSEFSFLYSEVQEAALNFALEHWEAVKMTPAFRQVVSGTCTGKIEGVAEIWLKLLTRLTTSGNVASPKP